MWLSIVIYQRVMVPIVLWIMSQFFDSKIAVGNMYIAVAWSLLVFAVVPVELYLKYSGRFAGAEPKIDDVKCPFLKTQEQGP